MNLNLKILSVFDALSKRVEQIEARISDVRKAIGPKGDTGPRGPKGETGPKGPKGDPGLNGANGVDGRSGRDGRDGKDGKNGQPGVEGTSVVDADIDESGHLLLYLSDDSEVDAGKVTPDTASGGYIISSSGGGGGGGAGVKYTEITSTTYTVLESNLISGHNLYGVDSGGDTVVFLPTITDPTKIVVVSNEMTGTEFTVTTQAL